MPSLSTKRLLNTSKLIRTPLAVGRSEKRLKERTDERIANNLWRMASEAEQRELRLRDDMEKLRTQQEQTLGTLDTS